MLRFKTFAPDKGLGAAPEVVDAADYVVWRKTLGQTVNRGTSADGDGNATAVCAETCATRSRHNARSAVI